MTCSKFDTEDLQIFGTTLQNSVAWVIWRPGLCTPWVRIMITDITLCQPLPFVHKKRIFLNRDSEYVSVPGIYWCNGIAVRSFTQHEFDLLDAASIALGFFLFLETAMGV